MDEHGEESEAFGAHEIVDAGRLRRIGETTGDRLTQISAIQRVIRWATKAGKSITDPEVVKLFGLQKTDTLSERDAD
jgi:hypothetical protein